MLCEFLSTNRAELIERCRAKVSQRPAPRATAREMEFGIPTFLGQLIDTLRIEQDLAAPHAADMRSEISAIAVRHGNELLRNGFTVDQVVHDYGDLCQAVTELATEKRAPITAAEFHAFNLSLDNAIADAVTEFSGQRDRVVAAHGDRVLSAQLGFLAHALRTHLGTAMLSFEAIKAGGVGLKGATAAVLDASLAALRDLVDGALADARLAAGPLLPLDDVPVARLITEAQMAASAEARARNLDFTVAAVEPGLTIRADKLMLCSAVSNLLQNAFKFTRPHGRVSLRARGVGERVLIDVEDECGGLDRAEEIFHSVERHAEAHSAAAGNGLSISRRAVEASGGELRARDMPGIGCVFTIDLPRPSQKAA